MTQTVTAQAARLGGYDDASRLRQAQDTDWVLEFADPTARSVADLGCGIGSLLAAALDRLPDAVDALGLDREESRLAEARRKLAPYATRVRFRFVQADLRRPPQLADDAGPTAFDLVTLTSVLHWIHPDEEQLVRWISTRLRPGGAFLLTTHHPEHDEYGFGGSDDLARQALVRLGHAAEDVPRLLAAAGIIPIAVRTLSVDDTATLLDAYFDIDGVDERPAVVRAANGEEYQRFHAATFGTYYSRLVGADRQEDYFRAIGEVAQHRLDTDGHITQMPVRLWRCRPGASRPAETAR
ncbi:MULTISPECIES: class I SAM-dependent methyltransferase [unclassified Frankia]